MNKRRRELINATLPLVGYVKDAKRNVIVDKLGHPTRLIVPGSEGKRYDVILKWDTSHATIEAECREDVSYHDCLGNGVTVCKHVLTAIKRIFLDRGKHFAFCKTPDAAKNLAHIGKGVPVRVWSKQANKYIYGVVKDVRHG